jgi:hypothetical protein
MRSARVLSCILSVAVCPVEGSAVCAMPLETPNIASEAPVPFNMSRRDNLLSIRYRPHSEKLKLDALVAPFDMGQNLGYRTNNRQGLRAIDEIVVSLFDMDVR